MARVRVSLSSAAVRDQVQVGMGGRKLRAVGRQVERVARQQAPRKTGALKASIQATPVTHGPRRSQILVVVGVRYGIWQHEGTGIYAGRGLIYPKTAKRFAPFPAPRLAGPTRSGRLRPRGGGGRGSRGQVLIAPTFIRGIPRNRFLTQALAAVAAADPNLELRFIRP